MANLGYRGQRFDLAYEPHAGGESARYGSRQPSRVHVFRLAPGWLGEVDLRW